MNWKPGEPLPNVQAAEIDPRKFADYSMNPDNPTNQGKWMAFAAIGYDLSTLEARSAATLSILTQLRLALPQAPAFPAQTSTYGLRFAVQVGVQGPNGRTGKLNTIWQIDRDQENPRLITNWLQVQQEPQ